MRFDKHEKEALTYAFQRFKGKIYLYGSRIDDTRRGGDIDLLLIPDEAINPLKLAIEIQKRFFSRCEQKLDVLIYREDNAFCREVMSHAKRLDIESIMDVKGNAAEEPLKLPMRPWANRFDPGGQRTPGH